MKYNTYKVTVTHPTNFHKGSFLLTVHLSTTEGMRFCSGSDFGCSRDYSTSTDEAALKLFLAEHACTITKTVKTTDKGVQVGDVVVLAAWHDQPQQWGVVSDLYDDVCTIELDDIGDGDGFTRDGIPTNQILWAIVHDDKPRNFKAVNASGTVCHHGSKAVCRRHIETVLMPTVAQMVETKNMIDFHKSTFAKLEQMIAAQKATPTLEEILTPAVDLKPHESTAFLTRKQYDAFLRAVPQSWLDVSFKKLTNKWSLEGVSVTGPTELVKMVRGYAGV